MARGKKGKPGGNRRPGAPLLGAGTQRSLRHFSIGDDLMPLEVIRALALIKKAAAMANQELGKLSESNGTLIIQTAEEILEGRLNDNFSLRVFITGNGSQSNMNVNEIIANRANELASPHNRSSRAGHGLRPGRGRSRGRRS